MREEFLKFDVKGSLNSSILIIYDDIYFENNNEYSKKEQPLIKVKFIDFAYFGKDKELKDQLKDDDLLKKLELNNSIDPVNKFLDILNQIKFE
jgi:hypothetical protein